MAAPTRLRRLWNYQEVDFEEVNRQLLRLNWSPVLVAPTIDEALDSWKRLFFSVIHEKVPSKVIAHIRPKSPWVTRDITALIKEKHKIWRQFKRSGSPEQLAAFRQIRNKVTSKLCTAEHKHLEISSPGHSS